MVRPLDKEERNGKYIPSIVATESSSGSAISSNIALIAASSAWVEERQRRKGERKEEIRCNNSCCAQSSNSQYSSFNDTDTPKAISILFQKGRFWCYSKSQLIKLLMVEWTPYGWNPNIQTAMQHKSFERLTPLELPCLPHFPFLDMLWLFTLRFVLFCKSELEFSFLLLLIGCLALRWL